MPELERMWSPPDTVTRPGFPRTPTAVADHAPERPLTGDSVIAPSFPRASLPRTISLCTPQASLKIFGLYCATVLVLSPRQLTTRFVYHAATGISQILVGSVGSESTSTKKELAVLL